MRKYLSEDVFNALVNKKTKFGYTFSQAINSGIINPDSNIGVYVGDQESYAVFATLFDPIIEQYHGFKKADLHKSNFNIEDLDIENPDLEGKYILSTRIRVGRNLKDIPLGSLISDTERIEVSSMIQSALLQLKGNLSGKYYSLNKMSDKIKKELINDHFLFKQGDRFLEAAGLNRDWPNGRGIFFNKEKNFLTWVNEEDTMRIISMEKGGDIKAVFSRLVKALNQLENQLDFAFDKRLGYISSCPTNLGTAMRASVHIHLPNLAKDNAQLVNITNKYHLQIRGIHGEHSESEEAIFDISNLRRLGITEVEAVKDLYMGVVKLIQAEKMS